MSVDMLNGVWRQMQTVNTCAAIVWAKDAEHKGRYKMYPQKGKKAEREGGNQQPSTDNG